ncbi:GGDEF domain-containing protein [Undibacterium sp.]|uniref:GGDEF domain-containing protein n=1 Tax=Undibacterium sp. TaxID=1914977 RepID=UPI00374CCE45
MDSFTLLIASALASVIMAATMYMMYRASPRDTYLLDWSLAGAFNVASGCCGLLASTHSVPYLVTPAIGNAFYVAGHYAILAGLQRHFGQRSRPVLILLLLAAVVALHFLPFARESVANRLLLLYPIVIFFNLCTIRLLWKAPEGEAKPAYLPLMLVELLFVAQLLLRAAVVAFGNRASLTFVGSQFLQTSGSLATFVFLSVATMSCALIVIRGQELALRRLALTDSLTGWLNRRALQDMAGREFQRSTRTRSPLAFIIFDIDHFKSINDRFGHAVGDAAIRHVTEVAACALRGYDGRFRIGGEEFAALVTGMQMNEAKHVAERVREQIASVPLLADGKPVSITVSVGLASREPEDASWEDSLRRADDALYHSKQNGRNRVSIASVGDAAVGKGIQAIS